MKKVIIKIRGTQGIDGEKEVIELDTVGTMRKQDNTYILTYKEGEMLGENKVTTKLSVTENHTAVMERNGDMCSRLVIEKGKRNNCFYESPYGSLAIGIFGEYIENRLTDSGGSLEMSYNIDSNLVPISKNKVEITVNEADT